LIKNKYIINEIGNHIAFFIEAAIKLLSIQKANESYYLDKMLNEEEYGELENEEDEDEEEEEAEEAEEEIDDS
jgi:sortase (surface protein transpeptidase)